MLKSYMSKCCEQAANLQLYLSQTSDDETYAKIAAALADTGLEVIAADKVSGGWKLALYAQGLSGKFLSKQFRRLSEEVGVDIAFIEAKPVPSLDAPGILFMDMDSTLIQCECIDEIADFLGIKKDIAAITQQAMEGKLDFSESLLARVKLLEGLDESVLKRVYDERIDLTKGAETLIKTVHEAGWKVGLVSGGFTYFTSLLQQRLGLDFVAANTLDIVDGKLTGRVLGNIVDAQVKKALFKQQSEAWGIDLAASMALGDGANDLPMLETAGLGIAFHAKPKVRELAPYALSDGGLDQALHLLTAIKPSEG
ncbi:MAG: phosphoserine phosphatase SerB [Ghiorsea sp.]|nr:phosphoserine phosphatase SerB [Ghiorsea sp.]